MVAKRKNQFGLLKLETVKDTVVKTGNGMVFKMIEDGNGRMTSYALTDRAGVPLKIEGNPQLTVQLAEIIKTLDKGKRFNCSFHGSYETVNGNRQPPACPNCQNGALEKIRTSGELVYDDSDV